MRTRATPRLRPPWRGRAPVALLLLAVLGATLVVVPSTAEAQTAAGTRGAVQERQDLEDQLAEATAAERRLLEELLAIEATRARLDEEVVELDEGVDAAEEDFEAAEDALARAMGAASALERRLDDTTERLAEARALLQDQAVTAFVAGGDGAAIREYLKAEDLRQLGAARTYTDAVVEHQRAVVDEVADLRDEAEDLSERADAAEEDAVAARTAARSQRDAVGAARDEVAAARARAEEASDAQAEVLAEVQARKAAYEAELAAAAVVSSSITTLLQQYQAGQEVLPATAGLFSLPVPEAVVTSPFGFRTHPIYGGVRLHAGIDFGAPSGEVIFAAGDGVVVSAGRRGGYGNAVIIEHGNGLATLYGHQRLFIVKEGQRVRKGDAIGQVGSTGNSTGPHLHFEVRRLGAPVDPLAYL